MSAFILVAFFFIRIVLPIGLFLLPGYLLDRNQRELSKAS